MNAVVPMTTSLLHPYLKKIISIGGYYDLLDVPRTCTLVLQLPRKLCLEEKIQDDRKSKLHEYLGALDSKKIPV